MFTLKINGSWKLPKPHTNKGMFIPSFDPEIKANM